MVTKKSITQGKVTKQVKLLLNLQEINQNLDSLIKEINQLKEEASQEEKKFTTRQNQYDKHLPYLQRLEKEYDELRLELEHIKKRIVENEEKKKKIRTIKEFKAVNKEIDALNQQNAIKENNLLTKSEELEFKKAKVEKITTNIEEIKIIIDKKKIDLDTLIKERKDAISKFTKDKEKIEKKLPILLVKAFNRIYEHQYRIAVVSIENQICGGCYMKVPQQIEINVKKEEEIIFCPSCSRVLYIDKEMAQLSA